MKYKLAFSEMSLRNKIPYGDPLWSTFNGSFNNLEIEPIEIINLIYLGHPFTTWHKNNWRVSANYLLGHHIALDFDTEDERSSLPFLDKDRFISKYAAMIYTTPSHKPEAPKARVLFLLDIPIHQPKNYVLAVSALLWLFGTADRQCKDPCRFFYGSIDCDVEYYENVLPLEMMKEVIERYQETGRMTKRRQESHNYTPTTDQQEVADALDKIPPWGIDYDEWLGVLMGIHSAFGNDGLGLAESWAQGHSGEVERKWRSFNTNGNGSGQVTLRSLFAIAQRFGYVSEPMKSL